MKWHLWDTIKRRFEHLKCQPDWGVRGKYIQVSGGYFFFLFHSSLAVLVFSIKMHTLINHQVSFWHIVNGKEWENTSILIFLFHLCVLHHQLPETWTHSPPLVCSAKIRFLNKDSFSSWWGRVSIWGHWSMLGWKTEWRCSSPLWNTHFAVIFPVFFPSQCSFSPCENRVEKSGF